MQRASVQLKKVVSQASRNKHSAAKFEALFNEALQDIEVQVRSGEKNRVSDLTTLAYVQSDSRSKSNKRAPAAYECRRPPKQVASQYYCCPIVVSSQR